MDAKTKEQNLKDLKFYRLIIAVVFVITFAIALVVALVTIDSYSADAYFTNKFLSALMPNSITDTTDSYAEDMVFYVETNKEYDVNTDEPISAFNYYYKTDDGEKIYLDDGCYYPAEYYFEDSDVSPIPVYLGFYYSALTKVKTLKTVINVIVVLIALALVAFLIYLWYRSWSKREDKRRELARQRK